MLPQLLELASLLHAHIVKPDSMTHLPRVGGLGQLAEVAVRDTSLGHRVMRILFTGRQLPTSVPVDDRRAQKALLGPFVAVEIARKLNNERRCDPLPSYIADMLDTLRVPKILSDMFRALSIASTAGVLLRRPAGQEISMTAIAAFKSALSAWDMWRIQFDNIGMKALGVKVGYKQYVSITWTRVPFKALRKVGFYSMTADGKYKISRERRTIQEAFGDEPTGDELLPLENDYNCCCGHRALMCIEIAMELLTKYELVDDEKELPSDDSFTVRTVRNSDRGSHADSYAQTLESALEPEHDESNIARTMYRSRYGEQMDSDNIIPYDLNAKETVRALLHYNLRVFNETMKTYNAGDSPPGASFLSEAWGDDDGEEASACPKVGHVRLWFVSV